MTLISQVGYRCAGVGSKQKTVFLPRSRFPIRHDPKVELTIQEDGKFSQTYLEQDPSRRPYIVHDGPPFANGQIHLGHAINKILKDIAARYAMITGHRVEFVTGWDCHGLPIEMQVAKILEQQQRNSTYGGNLLLDGETTAEEFRIKARAYAKSQIDLQLASFKRMGLLTDWNKRYTTDDPSYVANQLRAFSQLFEQKLVFKDLLPVNWSITNQTTIADADIEYRNNHISKSAYVLYELINPPISTDNQSEPLYALIWTTTPWTLLENRAIAFNKQETYCILRLTSNNSSEDVKNLLVSLDSAHKVQDVAIRLGYQCEIKTYVPGKSLIGLKYKPLLQSLKSNNIGKASSGEPLPLLDADFVEGVKGTGLVHLAPNYGYDDFSLLRKNKIPIEPGLVDTSGCYTSEAGNSLAGKSIFSEGIQEILHCLDQHQALLFTENTQHKYPYETRTNRPVIVRASQQIFLDTSRIVPRCLKALESTSIFPERKRKQFVNTLASSPAWCISRQRFWGTPIPVFYEKSDTNREKMISHPLLVEHFCKLLYKRRFVDYWWTVNNDELAPQELLDKCKLPYKPEDLVRGTDIFDVWSDSGLSWHTTTNSLNDPKSQADIYLEGSDQIRGWFSASSILSIALRGCLPTKRFFMHGFVLDEEGSKMSKSKGNVVDPVELFKAHGVDPIRLWAARSAGDNNDVCVNLKEFKSSIPEAINKIRGTFRFLIGALADHDAIDDKYDHTKLEIFDQYYLDKLYRFASSLDEHYKNYRYDLLIRDVIKFISLDLSPVYITTTKDVLYCDELNSKRRKSCLTVLNITYNILLRCLYPVIPHIVFEAGQHMRPAEPLNEWQNLGYKASWKNDALHAQFECLIKFRSIISRQLSSRVDMMRDKDAVLFLSDKKLFKQLVQVANSSPELMMELFKTSTFILGHNEKLSEPDDIRIHHYQAPSAISEQNSVVSNKTEHEEGPVVELLSSWIQESEQNVRIGGAVSVDNGASVRFEMCYRNSNNGKCSRCRRYTVLDVDDQANVCDRCKEALHKLELLD